MRISLRGWELLMRVGERIWLLVKVRRSSMCTGVEFEIDHFFFF